MSCPVQEDDPFFTVCRYDERNPLRAGLVHRGPGVALDSPRFARREQASRRLAEFGEDAEPTLRQALADKPSAQARQRLERILAGPRLAPPPDLLRSLRALQILEAIGDEPARRVLGRLAEGAPAFRLTREARAAVDRLTHR
jgi:hypothetical protein